MTVARIIELAEERWWYINSTTRQRCCLVTIALSLLLNMRGVSVDYVADGISQFYMFG